jgi:hypothetical protein
VRLNIWASASLMLAASNNFFLTSGSSPNTELRIPRHQNVVVLEGGAGSFKVLSFQVTDNTRPPFWNAMSIGRSKL